MGLSWELGAWQGGFHSSHGSNITSVTLGGHSALEEHCPVPRVPAQSPLGQPQPGIVLLWGCSLPVGLAQQQLCALLLLAAAALQ